MNGLIPTHVVFNGKVGALTGENALTANVGDNVLIVHSQANRDTRPHLIGGHGDLVWETGKFNNPPERHNETLLPTFDVVVAETAGPIKEPDVVAVAADNFQYRLSGEFLKDGFPVRAQVIDVEFGWPISIIKYQISQADYAPCIEDQACDQTFKPINLQAARTKSGLNTIPPFSPLFSI